MGATRIRPTVPEKFDREDSSRSITGRLRPVLSREQVQRQVLGMVEKLGLDSPQKERRLASWFLAFATAPDLKSLRRLKEDAEFVASTKGGSALKKEITDEDLSYVKTEVRKAIDWALDEKAQVKGVSTAPLNPFPADLLLLRVGNRFEKTIIPLDFTGRLLLRLFDLLTRTRLPFARCATCQGIFVRRGRQLYCSPRCAERVRAAGSRRTYLREYMRMRRAAMKRLKDKAPGLAERVRGGEITLNEARARMRKKAG
ncbi:MAG: hypothetical protein O7B35_01145 [Deltaproteobacteria bacterium]|nr:hypothetical protein [Deltaproteobacteria bacterium]